MAVKSASPSPVDELHRLNGQYGGDDVIGVVPTSTDHHQSFTTTADEYQATLTHTTQRYTCSKYFAVEVRFNYIITAVLYLTCCSAWAEKKHYCATYISVNNGTQAGSTHGPEESQ